MTNNLGSLAVAAALLFFPTAAPAKDAPKSEGTVLSVMASTQLHFGKLGIGAASTEFGNYLDENGAWKKGVYAQLDIAVEGEPSQFRQVKAREGQTIEAAGYRIFVEKVNPGPKGSAVLRLWAPPKPAKRWPFSWFDSLRN